VVKLWWVDGDLWCFDGRLLGPKNTPRFLDLFLGWRGKAKATTKAKAIMLSLRPSGFAPAFGRAVAAARWLRRWAEAPLYLKATAETETTRSKRERTGKTATADPPFDFAQGRLFGMTTRTKATATADPPPSAKDDNQKTRATSEK